MVRLEKRKGLGVTIGRRLKGKANNGVWMHLGSTKGVYGLVYGSLQVRSDLKQGYW